MRAHGHISFTTLLRVLTTIARAQSSWNPEAAHGLVVGLQHTPTAFDPTLSLLAPPHLSSAHRDKAGAAEAASL